MVVFATVVGAMVVVFCFGSLMIIVDTIRHPPRSVAEWVAIPVSVALWLGLACLVATSGYRRWKHQVLTFREDFEGPDDPLPEGFEDAEQGEIEGEPLTEES